MRHFIFLLGLVFSLGKAYSQDLVVTSSGDSLNCRITKIKKEYIYFVFKHKDEVRSTLLPLNQVKYYQYNYFKVADVPPGKIVVKDSYPHWRLAGNGGYSYLLARIDNSLPSYLIKYQKGLKSGYNLGGDLSYFIAEQAGVGFRYQLFKTSNQLDNIYLTNPDGTLRYGKLKDDISVMFIGPVLSTRLISSNKRHTFLFDLAIGYLGYKDELVVVDKYTQTGSSVGIIWDFGYDFNLTRKLALGANASVTLGSLNQYDIDDGTSTRTVQLEKGDYIGLGHFDVSMGLRYNL